MPLRYRPPPGSRSRRTVASCTCAARALRSGPALPKRWPASTSANQRCFCASLPMSATALLLASQFASQHAQGARVSAIALPLILLFELLGAYEEETRARYEPMIEDLQSKGIMRYYGYRDDMPEFYRHCQAVIHPSYHEGMSNVLQEAAATARPVIASDINGCREIFENGVSGLAFLPQNADSLTETIERFLLLAPEERAEMGRQARAYVEAHFDRRQVVTAYLETLGSLIGATRC